MKYAYFCVWGFWLLWYGPLLHARLGLFGACPHTSPHRSLICAQPFAVVVELSGFCEAGALIATTDSTAAATATEGVLAASHPSREHERDDWQPQSGVYVRVCVRYGEHLCMCACVFRAASIATLCPERPCVMPAKSDSMLLCALRRISL